MSDPTPRSAPRRIAILGAGFAGSMLAVQLRQRLDAASSIVLIDRHPPGHGVAYGTTEARHVLNVPAKGMSAFPDQPEHFLRWAAAQASEDWGPFCDDLTPDSFLPRMLYGRYISSLLTETDAAANAASLTCLQAEITAVRRADQGAGFVVETTSGAVPVDTVVLALGNPAPAASTPPLVFGDPWAPQALEDLPTDAPILLVGTGLTMADVVMTLREQRGHRGVIHAISRHGWAPLAHPQPLPAALPVPPLPKGVSLSLLWRLVRLAVAAAAATDIPWQAVMDGVRPQVQTLWRAASLAERRRFLRHARTPWNLHRHRVAPAVHAVLEAAEADGQLRIQAARLKNWAPSEIGVAAELSLPDGRTTRLPVARILMCTGPGSGSGWLDLAPLPSLRDAGMARADALMLGLDIDPENFALLGTDGAAQAGLYAIGPTTRSAFWESTAVPELRGQAQKLAELLSR